MVDKGRARTSVGGLKPVKYGSLVKGFASIMDLGGAAHVVTTVSSGASKGLDGDCVKLKGDFDAAKVTFANSIEFKKMRSDHAALPDTPVVPDQLRRRHNAADDFHTHHEAASRWRDS